MFLRLSLALSLFYPWENNLPTVIQAETGQATIIQSGTVGPQGPVGGASLTAIQTWTAQQNFNGGATVPPATLPTEPVNLDQAQADFAAINGSSSEVFNVAPATASNQAVNLSQVASVAPMMSQHEYTPDNATGGTYTQTVSFTAPSNGFIVGIATQNNSSDPQPGTITQTLSINGTNYGADSTIVSKSNYGVASVSAGTACTVTNTHVAGISTNAYLVLSQAVVAIFIPNP